MCVRVCPFVQPISKCLVWLAARHRRGHGRMYSLTVCLQRSVAPLLPAPGAARAAVCPRSRRSCNPSARSAVRPSGVRTSALCRGGGGEWHHTVRCVPLASFDMHTHAHIPTIPSHVSSSAFLGQPAVPVYPPALLVKLCHLRLTGRLATTFSPPALASAQHGSRSTHTHTLASLAKFKRRCCPLPPKCMQRAA